MLILATILAIVLAITGIVKLLDGEVLLGIALLVLACAVGPGGWSIWGR